MADAPQGQGKRPIIVRKKKVGHGGHHGGAWKVAYADFVTAMMAFFLVMWLVSQSDEVKKSVAGYFRDPRGSALAEGGSSALDLEAEPAEPAIKPKISLTAEEIIEALMNNPALAGLAGQIDVEVTGEGLRIHLMESADGTFFGLGSATPSDQGVQALLTIAGLIGPLERAVVVEGHTDSRPFSGRRNYSNWELSTDRANAARRILEQNGLPGTRVDAIRGYAATRPRYAQAPDDPRNRRISILVLGDQPPGEEPVEPGS